MSATILIVDDFTSVRLYHTSFLTRKGYHCLEASNGDAALALLRAHAVDLVVLDLLMPGMSSDAFLAAMAADRRLAAIPILIITSENALAENAFRSSPNPLAVLSKPVLPPTLLQGVQQLLAPAAEAAGRPKG